MIQFNFYMKHFKLLSWRGNKQLQISCLISTFGDDIHQMLRIIHRSGKHCSCHLQDAKTLDNSQHFIWFIPESLSYTVKSCCKKLRARYPMLLYL